MENIKINRCDSKVDKRNSLIENENLIRTVCNINNVIVNESGIIDNTFNFETNNTLVYDIFVAENRELSLIDSIKEYGDDLLNSKFTDKKELEKFIQNNFEYNFF